MKITKEQLMEIIEEELSMMEQDPAEAPPEESGEKTMSDVNKVLTYIEKINTYKEYGQLLQKILKHDVKGKDIIMKKILGNQIASAILKKLGTAE